MMAWLVILSGGLVTLYGLLMLVAAAMSASPESRNRAEKGGCAILVAGALAVIGGIVWAVVW